MVSTIINLPQHSFISMHMSSSVQPVIIEHLCLHTENMVDAAFRLLRLVLNEKCGNTIKTRLRFSAVLVNPNFGIDIVKTTMNTAMPVESYHLDEIRDCCVMSYL